MMNGPSPVPELMPRESYRARQGAPGKDRVMNFGSDHEPVPTFLNNLCTKREWFIVVTHVVPKTFCNYITCTTSSKHASGYLCFHLTKFLYNIFIVADHGKFFLSLFK